MTPVPGIIFITVLIFISLSLSAQILPVHTPAPEHTASSIKLNLTTAIAMALMESRELRNKQYSLELAEMQRDLLLQSYFPSLSASYSNIDTTTYNSTDSRNKSIKFSLNQKIFQGGRISNARKQHKLNLQSGKMEVLNISDTLKITCFSVYYSYLIQNHKIANQENILAAAKEQLRIARAEFAVGRLREVDLVETELKIQVMEQGLETQKQTLKEAAWEIRKLLGLDINQAFSLTDTLPVEYAGLDIQSSSESLATLALSSNLQIRIATIGIQKKEMEFRAARSRWLPNLSLEASTTFTGENYPLQNADYSISLNIELPLPWVPVTGSFGLKQSPNNNYGKNIKADTTLPSNMDYAVNKQSALLALESERENHKDLENDLRFQVLLIIERYSSLRKELNNNRNQVALLERQLTILEKEVLLGISTRLDFVTAQNDYIEKLLAMYENLQNLLNTERNLEKLIGLPFNTLQTLGVKK